MIRAFCVFYKLNFEVPPPPWRPSWPQGGARRPGRTAWGSPRTTCPTPPWCWPSGRPNLSEAFCRPWPSTSPTRQSIKGSSEGSRAARSPLARSSIWQPATSGSSWKCEMELHPVGTRRMCWSSSSWSRAWPCAPWRPSTRRCPPWGQQRRNGWASSFRRWGPSGSPGARSSSQRCPLNLSLAIHLSFLLSMAPWSSSVNPSTVKFFLSENTFTVDGLCFNQVRRSWPRRTRFSLFAVVRSCFGTGENDLRPWSDLTASPMVDLAPLNFLARLRMEIAGSSEIHSVP